MSTSGSAGHSVPLDRPFRDARAQGSAEGGDFKKDQVDAWIETGRAAGSPGKNKSKDQASGSDTR